jgi:FkbM family methyltransferase
VTLRIRGANDALRRAWKASQYRRIQRKLAAPKLFDGFAAAYPEAFFIEIGSNDGEKHDHLRPFILSRGWRGIMVEPVPYVFERLRKNYGHLDDRVALENVAIGDRDGRRPFFHLAEATDADKSRLPEWYDGIGSFSREVVAAHADHIPDLEQRIVEEEVPCLTFASLCRRHGVSDFDLLLIDTEGHDAEILRGIDIARHSPRMIVYEHFHLGRDERAACRDRIRKAGYDVMEEGFDTFCLDTTMDDPLSALWSRLRPGVPGVSAERVR